VRKVIDGEERMFDERGYVIMQKCHTVNRICCGSTYVKINPSNKPTMRKT
jgi:hypothetical protein